MSFNKSEIFLFIVMSLFLFVSKSKGNTKNERHIEVSMRMIGHQLLLNSGDSVSRILPIQRLDDRYKVQFESDFQFNPTELVATIDSVIEHSQIANSYLVEVEKCETNEVVYSYEIGNATKADVIPCGERMQPKGCYSVLITIMDVEASKKSSELSGLNYSAIVLLITSGLIMFVLLWKKNDKPVDDPNLVSIGKYQFDKRNMKLSIGNDEAELTSKEADLLAVLHSSANTTLEREVLLNVVWGDEGDYVGRSLDVFISKLRKKLKADPEVKITNIRGIGYKLVLNDLQA